MTYNSAERFTMPRANKKHFPFISIGILLFLIAAAPVVIGFVHNFNQLQAGQQPTDTQFWIGVAFHPIFVVCNLMGMLFIAIGIARALLRAISSAA
jgi:formate hydrogenlyase subunit 3/multisubunit Na+/H+ antiporter MnhD subunit